MLYKSPRGTADILPEEQSYWHFVECKAAETCRLYGYSKLETPVFEDSQLFFRSIGEGTDIVTKEMYVFKDQSGNSLALRPEGTASVCRAYLQHGLSNKPQPVKLYYLASLFRYERPQAGRFRQHHQFGYEAIGEADPALDAEVIEMAWSFYSSLGLTGLSVQLNSIGCPECRPGYLQELKRYYSAHSSELCPDCRIRMEKNPLRLLDCKNPSCQSVADGAPRNSDLLCSECSDHFAAVQKYLSALKIPFSINHRLVRGLDYYTRTVFEIQPPDEGGQSALGGGGRYDRLIEELGGKPTPAIGFASGIERIIINLKKQNISVPDMEYPSVFIVHLGDDAKSAAVELASHLRSGGTGAILSLGERSMKAQLRQANNMGIEYAVIIGEDEVKNGTVILRNMKEGGQESIPLNEVVIRLAATRHKPS